MSGLVVGGALVPTYGKRREPLSARNAAILARRTAPPPVLPSALPPHPRDARLAAMRGATEKPAPAPTPVGHGPVADKLLAHLARLASRAAALPGNAELGETLGMSVATLSRALSTLESCGAIARTSGGKAGRAIEVTHLGVTLRSSVAAERRS